MTNDLKEKDYGGYVNHYGIYSFVEKCIIQKYIYLVVNINIAKNKDFYTDSSFVKVIFKYHKPENISIFNSFDEFISINKETFMAKLDETKAQIDATVNDEVDMQLKDKFTMDENLKNLFWKYILNCRGKIINENRAA